MKKQTIVTIVLVLLVIVLVFSIFYGSRGRRYMYGMEGFSDMSGLTQKEKELFEDLSNNKLSEDEIMRLVNAGVINDNLIGKFLGHIDGKMVQEKFESVATEVDLNNAKVSFYTKVNYMGNVVDLSIGDYDTSQIKNIANLISSIKVPKGLKVTLYEKTGFLGRTADIITDTPNLGTLNFADKMSSVKISKLPVTPDSVSASSQSDSSQSASSQSASSQSDSSQPASSQPASSQPASSQPASSQPASSQPASSQPASSQPASSQPASSQPASSQPASSQPASSQPASSQSASSQSASSQSASSQPITLDNTAAAQNIIQETQYLEKSKNIQQSALENSEKTKKSSKEQEVYSTALESDMSNNIIEDTELGAGIGAGVGTGTGVGAGIGAGIGTGVGTGVGTGTGAGAGATTPTTYDEHIAILSVEPFCGSWRSAYASKI